MSVHVVTKKNPHLPVGTWLELFDDGFRQVETETVDNRLRIVRSFGLVYPRSTLRPYTMVTLKRGLDKWHGDAC